MLIYVGRPDRFVTQPERDDRTVHSCVQQLHGATVPEHVRRDPLGCKGGAGGCSGGGVPIDDAPDGVPAETLAVRPRKQWVARLTAAFAKPVAQHRDRLDPERGGTLLSPLPDAGDMSTGAKGDVLAA